MRVLGIETSCDETSAAIVRDGRVVESLVTASSIRDFASRGGVVPEYAARRQLEWITRTIDQSLNEVKVRPEQIDLIAVTHGPGLLGSLLVGTTTARVFASLWSKPLLGIHHTLGHLSSTWLAARGASKAVEEQPTFPILTLSVSGGHSDLWLLSGHMEGSLIATTLDDAAGEAFDKGASLLGLPYPGGPALAKLAQGGREDAYAFPSPLAGTREAAFSFSGLKTALKYLLRDLSVKFHCDTTSLPEDVRRSLAASYQHAICTHLISRVEQALEVVSDVKEVHIVGGVSANLHLRSMIEALAKKRNVRLRVPAEFAYCTDNAAMIASAGYYLAHARPEMLNRAFTTEPTVELAPILEASRT